MSFKLLYIFAVLIMSLFDVYFSLLLVILYILLVLRSYDERVRKLTRRTERSSLKRRESDDANNKAETKEEEGQDIAKQMNVTTWAHSNDIKKNSNRFMRTQVTCMSDVDAYHPLM